MILKTVHPTNAQAEDKDQSFILYLMALFCRHNSLHKTNIIIRFMSTSMIFADLIFIKLAGSGPRGCPGMLET